MRRNCTPHVIAGSLVEMNPRLHCLLGFVVLLTGACDDANSKQESGTGASGGSEGEELNWTTSTSSSTTGASSWVTGAMSWTDSSQATAGATTASASSTSGAETTSASDTRDEATTEDEEQGEDDVGGDASSASEEEDSSEEENSSGEEEGVDSGSEAEDSTDEGDSGQDVTDGDTSDDTQGDEASTEGGDASSDTDATGSGVTSDSTTSGDTTADPTSDATSDTTDTSSESSDSASESSDGEQGTIELTDIIWNQGVGVTVVDDRALVPASAREARLVRARPALVRASWALSADWEPRDVRAELSLQFTDGSSRMLVDTQRVEAKANLAKLDGTFHWLVEAEDLRPGVKFRVENVDSAQAADAAQLFPASGHAELTVPAADMRISVVFVPFTMAGVPTEVTDAMLDSFTDAIYVMNPVSSVDVSLHAAVEVENAQVFEMLEAIGELRASEMPHPSTYYIGLAAESELGWQSRSRETGPEMDADRSAVTAVSMQPDRFPDDDSWGFLLNTLGHLQGRTSIKGCGGPDADPDWPWSDSAIHTYGYDIVHGVLRDQNRFQDYMSYCFPDWASAHTYEGTAERIELLSSWR